MWYHFTSYKNIDIILQSQYKGRSTRALMYNKTLYKVQRAYFHFWKLCYCVTLMEKQSIQTLVYSQMGVVMNLLMYLAVTGLSKYKIVKF